MVDEMKLMLLKFATGEITSIQLEEYRNTLPYDEAIRLDMAVSFLLIIGGKVLKKAKEIDQD